MKFFATVPDMPIDAGTTFPSAGPYFIAPVSSGGRSSRANPNYKGSRPANPDQIVFTANTDQDQSLLQVKSGQADSTSAASRRRRMVAPPYGVNKSRSGSNRRSSPLLALNTSGRRSPT